MRRSVVLKYFMDPVCKIYTMDFRNIVKKHIIGHGESITRRADVDVKLHSVVCGE